MAPAPPTREVLLARLAEHRSLGEVPVTEREWLVDHATFRVLPIGYVVTDKGAQATELLIVLSGHIVIRVDRGAGAHKVFEWHTGDVSGVMPYSRGASPPSDAIAEQETEVLAIPRALLPDTIRECRRRPP